MTSGEYARQLQEKFELYLIALVFTILGLAIQTAKFGTSDLSDAFEIAGWLCLMGSGITSLLRMELLPVAQLELHKKQNIEDEVNEYRKLLASGQGLIQNIVNNATLSISTLIQDRVSTIQMYENRIAKLQGKIYRGYLIHKWLLVGGLIFLGASRSFSPVSALVKKYWL
jgi:hypothetical protein